MIYDVAIVGAGPAGISASLYTQRANLKTIIFYSEKSNLEGAENIQNYYGFKSGISGKELYETGIVQAKGIGVEIKEEEVINIEKTDTIFKVRTSKNEIEAKTVILSTGTKKNKPKVKGIKEFEGRGISYCAVCDGFFYKDRNVAVLGNGEYAINEATELMNIAKHITILTDGKEEPSFRADNIDINSKEINKIDGEKRVNKIEFNDGTEINVDAVFVAVGTASSSDFAKKIGAITENDKIVINDKMETNIKGLYACGDCTGGLLQVSKAVYEGAQAGVNAIQYIRNNV